MYYTFLFCGSILAYLYIYYCGIRSFLEADFKEFLKIIAGMLLVLPFFPKVYEMSLLDESSFWPIAIFVLVNIVSLVFAIICFVVTKSKYDLRDLNETLSVKIKHFAKELLKLYIVFTAPYYLVTLSVLFGHVLFR